MTPSSGDTHPDRMNSEQLRKRDDEILRLYVEEGLSPEGLAARFGLRPSTVHGILRHRGVSLRRLSSGAPPHLKERNDEIARLRAEEGLTLKEIGERFNLGKERVRQVLIRAGVPREVQGGKGSRTHERVQRRASARGYVEVQTRNHPSIC